MNSQQQPKLQFLQALARHTRRITQLTPIIRHEFVNSNGKVICGSIVPVPTTDDFRQHIITQCTNVVTASIAAGFDFEATECRIQPMIAQMQIRDFASNKYAISVRACVTIARDMIMHLLRWFGNNAHVCECMLQLTEDWIVFNNERHEIINRAAGINHPPEWLIDQGCACDRNILALCVIRRAKDLAMTATRSTYNVQDRTATYIKVINECCTDIVASYRGSDNNGNDKSHRRDTITSWFCAPIDHITTHACLVLQNKRSLLIDNCYFLHALVSVLSDELSTTITRGVLDHLHSLGIVISNAVEQIATYPVAHVMTNPLYDLSRDTSTSHRITIRSLYNAPIVHTATTATHALVSLATTKHAAFTDAWNTEHKQLLVIMMERFLNNMRTIDVLARRGIVSCEDGCDYRLRLRWNHALFYDLTRIFVERGYTINARGTNKTSMWTTASMIATRCQAFDRCVNIVNHAILQVANITGMRTITSVDIISAFLDAVLHHNKQKSISENVVLERFVNAATAPDIINANMPFIQSFIAVYFVKPVPCGQCPNTTRSVIMKAALTSDEICDIVAGMLCRALDPASRIDHENVLRMDVSGHASIRAAYSRYNAALRDNMMKRITLEQTMTAAYLRVCEASMNPDMPWCLNRDESTIARDHVMGLDCNDAAELDAQRRQLAWPN